MKKRLRSKLSVLLAICLIVTATPMSVEANITNDADSASLEGTYIMYNSYSDSYAGPAGTAYVQGTAVQNQSYTGLTTQQWIVTKVAGTDRYMIMMGDYCLATASNGTDAYLQIPYGISDTYQQWYLEPTELIGERFGRYKIRTANTYNENMVLGVDGLATGTQLELRTYTNNSFYQDEWYICPIDECFLYLHPFYDTAYRERYASSYDVRINAYMQELQKIYITRYGIWINCKVPSHAETHSDSCTASYDEFCACRPDAYCANSTSFTNRTTYHHSNVYNIFYRLERSGTNLHKYAYFLGQKLCQIKTMQNGLPGHSASRILGLCEGQRLMSVSNTISITEEKKTVAHEFGHFFDAPDHYGTDTNGDKIADINRTIDFIQQYPNAGFDENCIYGENKSNGSVMSSLTICDGCASRIMAARNESQNG